MVNAQIDAYLDWSSIVINLDKGVNFDELVCSFTNSFALNFNLLRHLLLLQVAKTI